LPKERFIAYPSGASGKAGLVFGWAGWDHLQQLQAAIQLWQDELNLHGHEFIPGAAAAGDEGLGLDAAARERLHPILQTMADLLPWVRQWHDEDGAANEFEAYVSEQALRLEVSLDEARAYRRPARAGCRGWTGRRRRAGRRERGRPRSRCSPPCASSTAAPARPWRSWGPSSGRRRRG